MAKNRDLAYKLRWVILIVGLLCMAAGIFWVLGYFVGDVLGVHSTGIWITPLSFLPWNLDSPSEEIAYGINISFFLGLFFFTQWLFLRPKKGMAVHLAATSRPMKRSVIIAAFMATLLTTGLIASLLEIPDWWDEVCAATSFKDSYPFTGVWIAMLIMWAFWAWIFFRYWKQGDRYTQFGKMIRGLIAGSILELLVATPVHAFCYDRDDCYCARGSYTGLILGGTVLLWAFGPGIILLFLREKYRRERLLAVCTNCGYNLKGTVGDHCPECGEPIGPKVDRKVDNNS